MILKPPETAGKLMGSRISTYAWLSEMAQITAKRSTCARRQVGCVLVDWHNKVLSTGYNGTPVGFKNCSEARARDGGGLVCSARNSPSGEDLGGCHAVHAEQNALLQCPDVNTIKTCFVTTSPCVHCVKMLLNTSCDQIVFLEPYAHEATSRELWLSSPIERHWKFWALEGYELSGRN